MRRVFARVIAHATIGDADDAPKTFGARVNGKAVIEHHTPHDVRDTFATTHLIADYSRLPWVSQQLGHENTQTTLDHYYRFLPSSVTAQFANKIREAK